MYNYAKIEVGFRPRINKEIDNVEQQLVNGILKILRAYDKNERIQSK